MKIGKAADTLASLGHEDRLRALRLLVRHAPKGLCAGDIARTLDIAPSSLTFHMGVLKRVGLVSCRRERRSIVYFAVLKRLRAMMDFLVNDCCQGNPELCGFNRAGDNNPLNPDPGTRTGRRPASRSQSNRNT